MIGDEHVRGLFDLARVLGVLPPPQPFAPRGPLVVLAGTAQQAFGWCHRRGFPRDRVWCAFRVEAVRGLRNGQFVRVGTYGARRDWRAIVEVLTRNGFEEIPS